MDALQRKSVTSGSMSGRTSVTSDGRLSVSSSIGALPRVCACRHRRCTGSCVRWVRRENIPESRENISARPASDGSVVRI
eukprot:1134546-Prorocentrum_minimum.AAC.1